MPKKSNKNTQVMVIKKFGPQKVGTLVKVKAGYARNCLLPRGLCILAKGNEDLIKNKMHEWQKEYETQEQEDLSIFEKLKGMHISIKAESGFGGSLFGSITASNITKELNSKGINLPKKHIIISNPIKFLGDYDVEVNLHGMRTNLKVQVIPID